MTFEIHSLETIAGHREYNGVRVKMIASIKNTRTPFHVDFGVGDVIIPKSELRELSTQLDGFDKPEVMTYSLESTVAEKFDVIISLMELSSRMKDYYDIYYLATKFSFDARKLQEALSGTLENRGTSYQKDSLERVLSFAQIKEMQVKWNHFIKRTIKVDIGFQHVLNAIYSFLNPIFCAVVSEDEIFGTWNPQTMKYE